MIRSGAATKGHVRRMVFSTQRAELDTELDYLVGDELNANLGLRYELWPDNFAFTLGMLSRTGIASFLKSGGSTTSERQRSPSSSTHRMASASLSAPK